jgi:hypothetical protein
MREGPSHRARRDQTGVGRDATPSARGTSAVSATIGRGFTRRTSPIPAHGRHRRLADIGEADQRVATVCRHSARARSCSAYGWNGANVARAYQRGATVAGDGARLRGRSTCGTNAAGTRRTTGSQDAPRTAPRTRPHGPHATRTRNTTATHGTARANRPSSATATCANLPAGTQHATRPGEAAGSLNDRASGARCSARPDGRSSLARVLGTDEVGAAVRGNRAGFRSGPTTRTGASCP